MNIADSIVMDTHNPCITGVEKSFTGTIIKMPFIFSITPNRINRILHKIDEIFEAKGAAEVKIISEEALFGDVNVESLAIVFMVNYLLSNEEYDKLGKMLLPEDFEIFSCFNGITERQAHHDDLPF